MKSADVKKYLIEQYPEFGHVIDKVDVLSIDNSGKTSVADAVTQTIIGQMLSKKVAQTIYKRVETARLKKNLKGAWNLSSTELGAQGVSGRKARSIIEFGQIYDKNPEYYESWRTLSYDELKTVVTAQKGLSTWSTDILAIFYFGLKDIFPEGDGTLKRAIKILNDDYYHQSEFDPDKAKPYRTFLSLYLWRMIDDKLI